jgi:hypothetical protein
MDAFTILFHLAATKDQSFLGSDEESTLLVMETNRLRWSYVPDPCGDKAAFATGYVMGREGLGRDPQMPEGQNRDYDLGYDRGVGVRSGSPLPKWDPVVTKN